MDFKLNDKVEVTAVVGNTKGLRGTCGRADFGQK